MPFSNSANGSGKGGQANIARILTAGGIGMLIDVGANEGQYARKIRQAGFAGRIVSIDPCSATHAVLAAAAASDDAWYIAPAMALGEQDGEIELMVYNHSDMNSIRTLSPAGTRQFPRLARAGCERAPLRRLDGLFDTLAPGDGPVAMKIDTQGAEREVLAGAAGVLERIAVLQVELAHAPLYAGAADFDDIVDTLRQSGLHLAMTTPVTFDKCTGRPIEIDALFLR